MRQSHRWQENKLKEKNNDSGRMGKDGKQVSAKNPFCWKEQFLSHKRSYFQKQSSATKNCMSSREKLDHLPQGRKQIHGKKKAHKWENSMRGGQSITSSKLKCFQIVLIFNDL